MKRGAVWRRSKGGLSEASVQGDYEEIRGDKMIINTRNLLSVGLALTLLAGSASAALARPGGGPPGGGPGAAGAHNPNGTPPIGKPATLGPDTDRGHSEGKGRTDTAGKHFLGRVTTIRGEAVTILMPTGTVRTFTVGTALLPTVRVGERVVLFTRSGGVLVTRAAPAVQTVRGTLVGVGKTTVTVLLPNGRMHTITVAPEAAENMLRDKGRPVIVSTRTAFTEPVTIRDIILPRLP